MWCKRVLGMNGRTIVEWDETLCSTRRNTFTCELYMHVTLVAVYRRRYNICFWQHQTSSKQQISRRKVAIINFSFGYFRDEPAHEISHDPWMLNVLLYFILRYFCYCFVCTQIILLRPERGNNFNNLSLSWKWKRKQKSDRDRSTYAMREKITNTSLRSPYY